MKKKTYNNNEIRKILEKNNYHLIRQSGGHLIYKNPNNSKTISVSARQTNKMVFRRLVKEYGLKEVV